MLHVVAGRHAAALSVALALILCPAAAPAQTAGPASAAPPPQRSAPPPDPPDEVDRLLDPSAPLEEWPDLGVPWPDMDADRAAPIPAGPEADAAANVADSAAARTYGYRIDGLEGTETGTLMARFRELSALELYRPDPPNAAQIKVTGRSQRPEIAFASTPALPQDELLSRILSSISTIGRESVNLRVSRDY